MDDIMKEIAAETLREKEILYVRNLLRMGFDFDKAVELAEVSAIPIEELRGMLLPGEEGESGSE